MGSTLPATVAPSRGLHILLWVVQGLLAAVFGVTGITKAITPIEQLAHQMSWIAEAAPGLVRFIGLAELTGAVGMILPAGLRVAPWLTGLAGLGLAAIMALAVGFHVHREEYYMLPVNFLLGGLALFVAWGRFNGAPIPSR